MRNSPSPLLKTQRNISQRDEKEMKKKVGLGDSVRI